MIFDRIENVNRYGGIHSNLDKAIEHVKGHSFLNVEDGTTEIDGENVYAMIMRYKSESADGREYEAHRSYIDFQMVVTGNETMICRRLEGLKTSVPYNADNDAELFDLDTTVGDSLGLPYGGGSELRMSAGDFVILFPEDAHVPKIATLEPEDILKVVVKIRID